MSARRGRDDLVLARLEDLMVNIANLEDRDLNFSTAPSQCPRSITQKYWPELWQPVNEHESAEETERRARFILSKMRHYLRRFWEAEKDEHARDWYIHRAREYYQRLRVLRETRQEREDACNKPTKEKVADALASLNVEIENRLDEPPARNDFEEALFCLQERARFPSLAPKVCLNKFCKEQLYFLSDKKGKKYCSESCSRQSLLTIKRNYWTERKMK